MRFLLLFASVSALFVAGYLTVLYGFTAYEEVQAELVVATARIKPATLPYMLPALAHTAMRYATLRGIIALVLAGSVMALVAVGRRGGRREMRRLCREVVRAFRHMGRVRQELTQMEKWTAGLFLLLMLVMRYWFLRNISFDPDEMVSLDYFARHGARLTAGFYQLPNNHVLYNVLGAALLRLAPPATDPELMVRLPSFVLGMVGTGLVYAALTCFTSFRVATFTVCYVQLVPMSMGYAITARGYGLQATCVYALFLAVVLLLRGPSYHRLAWAVVITSSLLGFYLIPTFIYPFLSLGAGLVGGAWWQGRGWVRVVQALVAGATVLVLTGLLYLPVGLLSGWSTLLANPYVAQLSAQEFWKLLGPYYLWGTAGELFGQQLVTVPLLLLLLSCGMLAIRYWAPLRYWPVAAVAWVGLVGPLPLLMAQRVFAPARTLHYVVFFGLLLAAFLFEAVVRRLHLPARVAWLLGGVLVAGYAGYRVPRQVNDLELNLVRRARAERAYRWMQQQHPRRVFTNAQIYHAYLQHLELALRLPPLPLYLAGDGPAIGPYDYLMLKRGSALPVWAAQLPYRLAYQQTDLLIYRLATEAPTEPAN
ncbi:hypothetical protein [Hymenobacter glacialis]|uniref:Glycosyltransferase RgtA/B/C/D-like domain-containing protein n=1 Tax=Hymenobacter glacialis TaxID=1908236 RepID=A0A1G1SZ04_9BACT|nr:hypothetical protein [Hymenobacter glacialis]OGX83853.1 hypothetical protein BEN48_03570 [Hymenobacter glacialis]